MSRKGPVAVKGMLDFVEDLIYSFTRRDELRFSWKDIFVFPDKSFFTSPRCSCFSKLLQKNKPSRAKIRTLDLIIHDLEKWRSRRLDHRRPTLRHMFDLSLATVFLSVQAVVFQSCLK